MNNDEYLKKKAEAIDILRRRYREQAEQVADIEPRLTEYFDHMAEHSSAVPGDDNDLHNYYEILGAIRFLRLMRTYDLNTKKVRQVIRLREGEWTKESTGRWRHIAGGLKQPGTSGARVFRWQPFQVYILVYVFGIMAWIDTHAREGDRDLLPTERVTDGRIEDWRRLCTDFTMFSPRKVDKTGMAAYMQVVFFLMEDYNAECYCCSNSADQSKLLYRRSKLMLQDLDDGQRIRMTETVCDWRPTYKNVRDSSIRPLSAGGRTKDGMFAQLCCADEYGSAGYTNGKSDMKMLVDVIKSSMGPRREPLTFTTTTAGRIQTGPFIEKLDALHIMLEREIAIDAGRETSDVNSDSVSAILFEPDEWERDEEYLLTSHTVRRKVNPMLGIICQHQFYDNAINEARISGDMAEVMSKQFNVYQSMHVIDWIKPEEIRALQIHRRIDDCVASEGWVVFSGSDFSKGDDLNTMGWMAANVRTKEFFADADCWVSEAAAEKSPLRELYRRWEAEGWLRIVRGQTFDPTSVVQRVDELTQKGVNIWRIGYDPYNAAIVINALAAFIADMGRKPEQHIMVIKQGYATYNSLVNEFDYMVHRSNQMGQPDPMIHFSDNPMIPWQFGNVALGVSTDGYENKKPVKRNPGSEACKVDSVQAILSALKCYDVVDGGEVSDEG